MQSLFWSRESEMCDVVLWIIEISDFSATKIYIDLQQRSMLHHTSGLPTLDQSKSSLEQVDLQYQAKQLRISDYDWSDQNIVFLKLTNLTL